MSDKESQKDEICVLESIYNEEELQIREENGLSGGFFYAYIELPSTFRVIFKDLRQEESEFQDLQVKFLPPLILRFSLPDDYPSHSPPTYRLSCQWLINRKLLLLSKKLDSIWKENEGTVVLFHWTQFLKEEILQFLGITDTLDISSLETTYLKREEFKKARKAAKLKIQERKREEKNVDNRVHTSPKDLDVSARGPNVEQSRWKHRGRERWGKRDRGVSATGQQKKDNVNPESKTESTIIKKTEAMTLDGNNTGIVEDGGNSSQVTFINSRRGGFRQAKYSMSDGRGRGNNRNRSLGRGNGNRDSHYSRRNYSPKNDNPRVPVNEAHLEEHKNLLECNNQLLDNKDKYQVHKSLSDRDSRLVVNNSDKFEERRTPPEHANIVCNTVVSIQNSCNTKSSGAEKSVQSSCVESVKKDKKVESNSKKALKPLASNNEIDSQVPQSSTSGGNRRFISFDRPRMSVVKFLTEYNETRQRIEFSRSFYTCNICFQDKQGSQCTRFQDCGHIFCKSCVSQYFEVRIKEGTVHNICCPEGKCASEALPSQIQQLVSPESFSRYDSVLLSALLDTMEDVLYCPRPACQYPVAVEPGEKMANCPACSYAFCIYCKMVYHGIEPCRFRAHEKRRLVEEYCNASEERRIQMEQRYGKKQLQALVDTSLSENWLDSHSKKCPHCNSAIEKSDGCNKMVCWKCNTIFCWLCEHRLNPDSPYVHFNNPASKCYNLLFHGVPLSDDDDDDEFGWVYPEPEEALL